MHYGKSFARVQAIDTLKPAEIGQRMDMSPIDVFEINSLYKCGRCLHFIYFPRFKTRSQFLFTLFISDKQEKDGPGIDCSILQHH